MARQTARNTARKTKTVNEVTMLGTQFIRWGLGLFIFGLIIGYGSLAYSLRGALAFLPWMLSASTVQVGSLGMVVIGCVYLHLPTDKLEAEERDLAAFWLCVAGLIAVFLTGYIGYFVVNAIWPSFYVMPFKAGKNVWLIAQGLSILLYVIGVVLAYLSIRNVTEFRLEGSRKSSKAQ
jgi:hypothetical protein